MPRATAPLLLGAAALVLGAGAVAARSSSSASADEAAAATRREHAVEVVQVRTEIERAHLDEADLRLLDGLFGLADPAQVDAAAQHRAEVRRSAGTELERLASAGDPAGRKAADLLSALRNDGLDDEVVPAPDSLTYVADLDLAVGASTYPGPADEVRPDLDDLARVASIGAWTLDRAIDERYLAEQPDAPAELAAYLELVREFPGSGGLLAAGAPDELLESVQFPTEPGPTPTLLAVQQRVVRSPVAAYDRWLSAAAADPAAAGEPPSDLGELARQAAELDASVRGLIDDRLRTEAAAERQAAAAAEATADRWAALAVALATAALASLAAGMAVLIARARRDARRATTDPLTGVGNRHLLEEATVAWLADDDLRWHLLAMVDLDRFKLVNDTWGHAAGDALLVRVARELQGVVTDLRADHPERRGAVVRMGGDEFLLSLHAPGPLDATTIRERLQAVRTGSLRLADGTPVPLRFSIGIATADGHPTLDDLERAADLASYEDKAARAQRAGDVTPREPVDAGGATSR